MRPFRYSDSWSRYFDNENTYDNNIQKILKDADCVELLGESAMEWLTTWEFDHCQNEF